MPYTTLVPSTTITSAWANANIRDQVVTPFASASARDSAITTPVQGMICYTIDTDWIWRYNGTKWIRQPKAVYTSGTGSMTTTTFVDIPGFTFTGDTSSTYVFDGWVSTVAATAGDVGLQWALPGSATIEWGVVAPTFANAGTSMDTTVYVGTVTTAAGLGVGGMSSNGAMGHISGVITIAGTSGTCKMQANNTGASGSSFVRTGFLTIAQVA